MAQTPMTSDGSAAAALLHPLERTFAAALHEHAAIAQKRGRAVGPLSCARACIHALARFLVADGLPEEATSGYALDLAMRSLRGRPWLRFKELEAAGAGAHEALHTALNEAAGIPGGIAARVDHVDQVDKPSPLGGEMAARCIAELTEHLRQIHAKLESEAARAHLLSTSGDQFDDERRYLRNAISLIEAIRTNGYEAAAP